jgi:hypothetical protein
MESNCLTQMQTIVLYSLPFSFMFGMSIGWYLTKDL